MLGTLKRAGTVLDLFTPEDPEWGVTATAVRLGIGKSLAHDVLVSLTAIGLLQRVGHGRYRLGWRTVSLASVLLRTSELKASARPVLRELAEREGGPAGLMAWDRQRIICIDRHPGVRSAGTPSPAGASARLPGMSGPVDGCAAAKVLLAGRSTDEIRALWIDGFVETRHASIDELEAGLQRVRVEGWACDDADEPVLASRTVAAPIRDPVGSVVAAVSLDLAARRDANLQARVVVGAASRISAAMRHCAVSGL
jgi:DNA-binding IclR family transcriptional regulator